MLNTALGHGYGTVRSFETRGGRALYESEGDHFSGLTAVGRHRKCALNPLGNVELSLQSSL